MVCRGKLNSYYPAGLLALIGAMSLQRWGHGNFSEFAEGALFALAVLLLMVGISRTRCSFGERSTL